MEINEFPRGQLNPIILSTMLSGDKYGYEIIEEIKNKTGIEIKQPSLYSSLKRMEVLKFVSSYWKDSAIGGKRHYYCLTNDGRNFLEKNPVDFSIYNSPAQVSQIQEQVQPEQNESASVLEQPKNEIKIAEQENIFKLVKENKQEVVEETKKSEQTINSIQYDLFNEVDLAADDGKFITETLEDYYFPKFEKFEPASLNIEQRSPNYLNAKIKTNYEDRKTKTQFKENMSELYVKKQKPFNHEQSMAKIHQKIDEFERSKHKESSQAQPAKSQTPIKKEEFNRVENTYIREKSPSKIYNSYTSLESYYNSKGIGFSVYASKDKSTKYYVNPALIRFVRGCIFFAISLILALAFYFGISYNSNGKVIYIIIPSVALVFAVFYCFLYYKSKTRNIIQIKKEEISPLILPLVSVALILITIGINLIIGFRASLTMEYFPILIYPIIISFYFAFITPLNYLISYFIIRFRNRFKYKK